MEIFDANLLIRLVIGLDENGIVMSAEPIFAC